MSKNEEPGFVHGGKREPYAWATFKGKSYQREYHYTWEPPKAVYWLIKIGVPILGVMLILGIMVACSM